MPTRECQPVICQVEPDPFGANVEVHVAPYGERGLAFSSLFVADSIRQLGNAARSG
jgi:hypothetical protein